MSLDTISYYTRYNGNSFIFFSLNINFFLKVCQNCCTKVGKLDVEAIIFLCYN